MRKKGITHFTCHPAASLFLGHQHLDTFKGILLYQSFYTKVQLVDLLSYFCLIHSRLFSGKISGTIFSTHFIFCWYDITRITLHPIWDGPFTRSDFIYDLVFWSEAAMAIVRWPFTIIRLSGSFAHLTMLSYCCIFKPGFL